MEENKFLEIINCDLAEMTSELIEIPLDNFISDENVKDIPVVGTIAKILNIGFSISDKIFIKKLTRFLNELNGLDKSFIMKEIKYIDDSKKYNYKIGEKLLEIIERIDSDGKPEIIGRLFKNFLSKELTQYEFLKLADIVEKTFYYDLILLRECNDNKFYIKLDKELQNFGLVEGPGIGYFDATDEEIEEFNKITYFITEKGQKLLDLGLKINIK